MVKGKMNRSLLSSKSLAIGLILIIVIPSISIVEIMLTQTNEDNNRIEAPSEHTTNYAYQKRAIQISSILSENGNWISFDNNTTPSGTPAEAHATISDTSGVTIVADFYGYWRNEYTTMYDELDMPGTSSLHDYGKPMLPCLLEYVQLPYNVDISVDVLESSSANLGGYTIRPAPLPDIPLSIGNSYDNISSTIQTIALDPIYSINTFFPGHTTSTEGESNSTSMIMRGHRLLGLSFYPIQYNPVTGNLTVYSQFIVKLRYSFPAQIMPVAENLRSEPFDFIIETNVLNYFKSVFPRYPVGVGLSGYIWHYPILFKGYEYLIITNRTFESQAKRLAQWKNQKGVSSTVHVIPSGTLDVRTYVKNYLKFVYRFWKPAPTYVLLMGDVEFIPANYDVAHEYYYDANNNLLYYCSVQEGFGNTASDLGYFNIEGSGYLPDMIYGRISVDTIEQAKNIVDKILRYEQTPPIDSSFYDNALFAGFFEDQPRGGPFDGIEDEGRPFIYTLEKIRHYLMDLYTIHINYSCLWPWYDTDHDGAIEYPTDGQLKFWDRSLVSQSIPAGYEWCWGFDDFQWTEQERSNISLNMNEGRFLVYYFGHGGSKNMIYNEDWDLPEHGVNRDYVEGWQHPSFNTSYFSDLVENNETPLIVSIACNTGWYDGETDQFYVNQISYPDNPFYDYENECFAENITRLKNSGAIAAISSSRIAYAGISAQLLYGITRAFWPGFMGSTNQPIYEMGSALLFGKLFAIRQWTSNELNRRRTTFEEYQLFGDPETQLWTDVPSHLTVKYPNQIGIGTQQFVVTVTDNSVPVSYAKVCLQKGSDIYDVGYTDPQGQVRFTVEPSYPGLMNVTVTKHNYIPHIGEMMCICSAATLNLIPNTGAQSSDVNFNLHGFYDSEDVEIYYESVCNFTIPAGTITYIMPGPSGKTGFANVIAKGTDSNQVSVTLFRCLPEVSKPDPCIFSQWDESRWGPGVSSDDIGWYNPDIVVYNGEVPVTLAGGVYPTVTYTVLVTVHNQGDANAVDTVITLWYAKIGGGVSWDYAGEFTIPNIPIDQAAPAWISWSPESDGVYCLKVEISNERDMNLNNNIGVLAVNVMEYSSPVMTDFYIGNPTDTDDYVFICVKQQGNHVDVWNATIMKYSSQVIKSNETELISMQINPGLNFEGNESRHFVADIYVRDQLVGGLSFNVSKTQPPPPVPGLDSFTLGFLSGVVATLAVIVLAAIIRRKQ
jgi:hypothetical protein